jgi:hypothetical protein
MPESMKIRPRKTCPACRAHLTEHWVETPYGHVLIGDYQHFSIRRWKKRSCSNGCALPREINDNAWENGHSEHGHKEWEDPRP